MRNISHTPAPWTATESKHSYEIIISAKGYEKIAVITDRHDNYEANATFIIKAVNCHDELLAALKAGITVLTGGTDDKMESWAEELVSIFRAAIAKAEGK